MTADPIKSIGELLEKRRPFYSKADLVIKTTGLTIGETVNKVIKAAWGWNNEKKQIFPRFARP